MRKAPESHASDHEMGRLLAGGLDEGEARRLLAHLVRCPHCREVQRPFLSGLAAVLQGKEAARPLPETAYDEAWERAEAVALRQEQLWARERAWKERLVAAAQDRLPFRLAGGPASLFGRLAHRAPGHALVEAYLTLSQQERYRDVASMEALALAAVGAAMGLGHRRRDQDRYPAAVRGDLQARALGELANAHRLNHSMDLAVATLDQAQDHLERCGSGDPMIEIRLLDIRASLYLDQRRLTPALDYLEEVRTRYLELGETNLAGRALVKRGIVTAYGERYQEAAVLFRDALGLLDPERDPKLVVNAHYELLRCLIYSQEFKEARAFLLQSGLRQALAEDTLLLQKLAWLEGKIALGLGKTHQAERIFRETKAEMTRHGRHYVAAMLGLELTAVYLHQGRADEAETEAAAALETFAQLQVSYEALRAVAQLQEACRLRVATAAFAGRIIHYLEQLDRNPAARQLPAPTL